MSNDQPARRPPAKSSGGGAPVGSTISIVIAVVAVIVGFLILRNINNDSGSTSASPGGLPVNTSVTTVDPAATGGTTTTTPPAIETTPTTAVMVFAPGTVVVANASNVNGAAGLATKALSGVGFTMGDPTNGSGAEKQLAATKVYFVAGADALGASVAVAFSTAGAPITAQAIPTPPPVTGGTIGKAVVLVMLGSDLAGKPLPLIAATGGATTATTTLTAVDISTSTSGR